MKNYQKNNGIINITDIGVNEINKKPKLVF